ncbi:MAG: hypothetical protein H6Q20_1909 [Bacteroidetes bacterium]|jgi:hemoglobin/transferrin/lactoferrin receptor protein|nr:hypothetical protein [Bacteroidota bacterium]
MTLSTLSLLLGASLSTAQMPADTMKQKEIKEITVYSISAQNLALPYVKVNQKTIEAHNFVTPADALSSETGISVVKDGSWATSLNVRGLSEQRLLLLSDNDRMLTATDIAGVMSAIDLNNLEKVEVIKGAGSVIYGTGAMGGVVNFVSERAGYSEKFMTSGKVSTGYSTVNKLWNNAANINLADSNWYIGISGSYRKAGNTVTPMGTISNSQFNEASWGLNGGMTYGGNQELLIGYNHSEAWDVGLPGSNVFPKTSVVRYKNFKHNHMNAEYIFRDLTDVLAELKFKAYMQNITRDVENRVNAGTLILPSSKNITYGGKATADLYFNDYNTMVVGVEGWQRDSETSRLRVVESSDTTVIGEQPTPNAKMFDAGAFILYKYVIDPKYLKMNFGLRGDYIRTQNDTAFNQVFKYIISDGQRNDASFVQKVLFLPRTHHQISYSAHVDLEYNPAKGNRIGVSVANSYRVPSVEERFKYIDQAGTLRVGNPNLKPERGFFGNLSYSYNNRKVLVKFDVFANYLLDLITEQQGTYNYPGGGSVAALVNVNVDKALYLGAEADVEWIVTRSLWVKANASYVRAKNADTGDYLPLIPPAHGLASVNYRLDRKFEASATAVWAAKQAEAAVGETQTPGYVIYNFDIHSTPLKFRNAFIQLFGGVENVFDKSYKNHLFNNRGIEFYEPGRNIFAKLKCSW